MQITEQTTPSGQQCTSLRLTETERYEHAGTLVTGITVLPSDGKTALHYYLAGPEVVQGPFHIDDVRRTVHPDIRGGVQQVLDRAVCLTPAPSLGRRLGKGHWKR